MCRNNELNIKNVIFSDECHFYLHGMPNKQNFRNWLPSKPMQYVEKPLHSPKVTVWCGLSSHKIYGPYFFEDPDTYQACTVSTETYLEMLNTLLTNDLSPDEWFQQDGAKPHTSNATMAWLQTRFPNKLISDRSNFLWPPRSPDLSPLDYFLWSYVKEKVYRVKPLTIPELKRTIQEIINSIDMNTLNAVIDNFSVRLDKCIASQGGHFELRL